MKNNYVVISVVSSIYAQEVLGNPKEVFQLECKVTGRKTLGRYITQEAAQKMADQLNS